MADEHRVNQKPSDYKGYRVVGRGTKPESHSSWHMTVELARIADQPSIHQTLCVPMADQLDDWKEYLHLKNIDRGKDFALLREIVSTRPHKATVSDGIS